MQDKGEKIAALTAYDASFAHLLESAGVDVVLVGDSLGMAIQGHPDTIPVTLEHVVYHTSNVARGCKKPLIMADVPFGMYGTPEQTLTSSVALIRAGAAIVKIEGGAWLADSVRLLKRSGILFCAHLGLTSQLVHTMGGYKIQGRDEEAIDALVRDALALQIAGADMMVLECVTLAAAERVLAAVDIPIIGIGAGPQTDGQILVTYDALGLTPHKPYKFVKNFMDGTVNNPSEAVAAYVQAVKQGSFPSQEHCF